MTTTTNGQTRKTLASQLDRLDSILDGLSDGLNEAVATAVQGAVELAVRQAVGQAVKEAMQAILTELLTNADLLNALRAVLPAAQSAQPTPNPLEPPKGLLGRACAWVKAGMVRAAHSCASVLGQLAGATRGVRAAWQLTWRFKGRVLAACGVGVAAGIVTLWAGPWLGVAAAWVGGFVTTLAVQGRNALRRLLFSTPAIA